MSDTTAVVITEEPDDNSPAESDDTDSAVSAALAERAEDEAEDAADEAEEAAEEAADSAHDAEEAEEAAEESAEDAEHAAESAEAAAVFTAEMAMEMRQAIDTLPARLAEVLAAREEVHEEVTVESEEIVPGEKRGNMRDRFAQWWYGLP